MRDKIIKICKLITIVILCIILIKWALYPVSVGIVSRIYCCAYLGFLVGCFFFVEIPRIIEKFKNGEWIAIILAISGLLSPLLLFSENLKIRLDNTFGGRMKYKIEKIFENKAVNEEHVIYGFDITEYKKSPTIEDNGHLQPLYNRYISNIDSIDSKDSLVLVTHPDSTKNIKYREFSRAKICADLIRHHKMNRQGAFSIYTIGTETKLLNEKSKFSKDNVETAIQKMFEIEYKDKETHLETYYDTIYYIVGKTKRDKYKFAKYILHTYSDFVQDKGTQSTHTDKVNIDKIRKGTNQKKGFGDLNIIENLFILPHDNKTEHNKNVVIDGEGTLYDRRIDVTKDINTDDEFGDAIHNIKHHNHTFYYSTHIVSPNIEFPDELYQIKLHGKYPDHSTVNLQNIDTEDDEILLSSTTFAKINKGKYAFQINGISGDNKLITDIARDDIHVRLVLNLKPNNLNWVFKIFVVLLAAICGACIPYFLVKLSNYINNQNTLKTS
ncbi:MAG: hypothetical protein LBD59_09520 [Prevotellaceae bacterium]|jgi:hypothetical protein|nr:hypothetical protein [Prevotellaceae bacterium]